MHNERDNDKTEDSAENDGDDWTDDDDEWTVSFILHRYQQQHINKLLLKLYTD